MNEEVLLKKIQKVQKKLATFEKDSRNYMKYHKILKKHITTYLHRKKINANLKSLNFFSNFKEKSNLL